MLTLERNNTTWQTKEVNDSEKQDAKIHKFTTFGNMPTPQTKIWMNHSTGSGEYIYTSVVSQKTAHTDPKNSSHLACLITIYIQTPKSRDKCKKEIIIRNTKIKFGLNALPLGPLVDKQDHCLGHIEPLTNKHNSIIGSASTHRRILLLLGLLNLSAFRIKGKKSKLLSIRMIVWASSVRSNYYPTWQYDIGSNVLDEPTT